MMHHTLHLYQKPKLGSALLARLPVYNYRHKISAVGWYDTASCEVAVNPTEAEAFLDQYIGNRVAVFVDNPLVPIWEGFINRMTFNGGGYSYTISLDEMVNRTQTVYTSAGAPTSSTAANNTDSQAIYGIKAGRVDMGVQGTVGVVNALRDTILAMRSWPQKSITQGSNTGLVTIEMLGFWHTLAWDNFSDASGTAIAVSTFITTVLLPAVANGATFFDNTDMTDIMTYATTALRQRTRGQTMQDILRELAETGDSTTYAVIGITPTNPATGTRRLYYRAANMNIVYTARRSDGLRTRNLYGGLVSPWDVRPDCGVRISDMLPGWNGLGDNPAETWIASVEYDASAQTVTWVGADNITPEGVFQLQNINRPHGRAFGAARRFV